ncbi:uncharacterized protein [Littorina saxatilis]|uniref:uncharacterized protein n=1 Tax=Littorina saxatilis TaxID=31220 RepID=UPI0038B54F51
MSVVCLLSLIYFLHIAHGYTISEFGSDGTLGVTDTQNVTLTCTGITDDDMFWAFTPPNRRGRSIAACVWFSSSCKVTNSVYEVSRTQYNTSTLTVKRNTRDRIAGLVKCGDQGDISRVSSCTVRVIATKETTAVYGSTTPKIPTATTVPPIPDVTSDKTTKRYNTNNDDDDNDDESNHTLVIAGVVAAAVFAVTIAVVTAIVVWKKISSEEDVYENTTGQQPAGHGTVEYVNTATGTQAAQGTIYMNV